LKTLVDVLASKTVMAVLLAAILVACAAATFLPLERALDQFYHSTWFFGLLILFAVNTAACTGREFFRRSVPLGFLFVHLGSLVLLAGGAWGYIGGESGFVTIPEGGQASRFLPPWKGVDEMEIDFQEKREVLRGRFRGIEQGEAVFFTMRREPAFIPLNHLVRIGIDPDRPGREFEKDFLHRKEGGEVEGFFREYRDGTLVFETEKETLRLPGGEVMFLRMGEPAVKPLGFTLRLKSFDIEYHEGTDRALVRLSVPDGSDHLLPPEAGAEVLLPGGRRVKVLRYIPDAVIDMKTREVSSRSDFPNNPAVEVEISWGEGKKEVRLAMASRMMPPSHGKKHESGVEVAFEAQEGMPKAFISEVEILEEGVVVGRRRIEVNAPLAYGGYYIFQNSYNARSRPIRSIFQVQKDPGLGLAYAGFVLLFLGVLHLFYFKPVQRYLRGRRGRTAEEAPAEMGTAEGENENGGGFSPLEGEEKRGE